MAQKLMNIDGTETLFQGKNVWSSVIGGVVKAVDKEKRTMTIVGTDESKDRDGDIIRVNGWKMDNYQKNPVFLWAHNYGSVPLARAEKVVRKRVPEPHMVWHLRYPTLGIYPFADMILDLYGEQIINASSVGFIPTKWVDINEDASEGMRRTFGREFTEQELLELSGCAVPSNPNALQNALKSASFEKSFIEGKMDPNDVINWLSGTVLIPNPDRADDILEELEDKGLEVVDETASFSIQVPESFSTEDSTKQVAEEEKEEESTLSDTTEKKEEEEALPITLEQLHGLFKEIKIKVDEIDLTVKSLVDKVEEDSKTLQTLVDGKSQMESSSKSAVDTILEDVFKERIPSPTPSKDKAPLDRRSVQDLVGAVKELKTVLVHAKTIQKEITR